MQDKRLRQFILKSCAGTNTCSSKLLPGDSTDPSRSSEADSGSACQKIPAFINNHKVYFGDQKASHGTLAGPRQSMSHLHTVSLRYV